MTQGMLSLNKTKTLECTDNKKMWWFKFELFKSKMNPAHTKSKWNSIVIEGKSIWFLIENKIEEFYMGILHVFHEEIRFSYNGPIPHKLCLKLGKIATKLFRPWNGRRYHGKVCQNNQTRSQCFYCAFRNWQYFHDTKFTLDTETSILVWFWLITKKLVILINTYFKS